MLLYILGQHDIELNDLHFGHFGNRYLRLLLFRWLYPLGVRSNIKFKLFLQVYDTFWGFNLTILPLSFAGLWTYTFDIEMNSMHYPTFCSIWILVYSFISSFPLFFSPLVSFFSRLDFRFLIFDFEIWVCDMYFMVPLLN